MIASLTGVVDAMNPGEKALIVTANDVGYIVHVSSRDYHVTLLHHPVSLHIHTILNDKGISLFGFRSRVEMGIWYKLKSVSKVGPKRALRFLSLDPLHLYTLIAGKKVENLATIKGIGAVMAQRVCNELSEWAFIHLSNANRILS